MSYNQPNKDIIDKLSAIIATKRMPFAFLVGNHPVYVVITLLKAENPAKYRDTMCDIYKRYKGSELGDVFVAGGVTAEGSVEHALKGKHYKRGLRTRESAGEGKLVHNLAEGTRENLAILKETSLCRISCCSTYGIGGGI